MWHTKIPRIVTAACVTILLLSPTETAPFGGLRGGNIGDLLTASVIGVILGTARHRLKAHKQQDESNQQPVPSAQHHQPYYTPVPWYSNSMQQLPMIQAPFMLPSIHHEDMLPPQAPFYPDMSSLLLQLNREQAYMPMASHFAPTIFERNMLQDFQGLDLPVLQSLQSWQTQPNINLPDDPMELANLVDSFGSFRNQQQA